MALSSESIHGNPIHETVKSLKILHGKSVNVTSRLSEALDAIYQAEDAGNSFVNCFVPNFNIKKHDGKTDNSSIKKGETLFVTVKSPLTNDGTFWCRVWGRSDNFDEDILDSISKELGWMEKEMTVKETQPNVLNVPMFFFSEAKSMYCRILVEKELDDSLMARFLDMGISGEVSKEFHFYLVPKSMLEKYPFQCIHGCLFSSDQKSFPYEIKWRFNDLTYNQVLMAKITETKNINNFPCNVLVLKSMMKEEVNITDALAHKVIELEEEKKEKERHNKRLKLVKTPPPLMPPVEQRKRTESDAKSKEKLQKDDHNVPVKKATPLVGTIEPVQQDAKTQNQDERYQRNSALLKVITQTVKDNILRKSRSREPSCCTAQDSDVPSRSKSLDCILSAEKSKRKPKKKSKSKYESCENNSKAHHSSDTDIAMKQSLLYVSGSHSKNKPVEHKKYCSATLESDCQTKSEDSSKEKDKSQHPTWIEQFSEEERRKVPPVIPNLQNLFYTSTQLRSEPWWEIELMNINKLLKTQANVQFYCYDVNVNRLESCLADSQLELFLRSNDRHIVSDSAKNYSQFVLFRNRKYRNNRHELFKSRGKQCSYIFGLARLDSGVSDKNGKYPVTFLSLSRFKNSMPEFGQNQGKPFVSLSLTKAKTILDAIKKSLANNSMVPTFPEYFPWCGVPPLVDIRKPVSKRQTKQNSQQRALTPPQLDVCGSTPPEKDTSGTPIFENGCDAPCLSFPDSTNIMPEFQEEVWDLDDGAVNNLASAETENDHPSRLEQDTSKEEEQCSIDVGTTDTPHDEASSKSMESNQESEKGCSTTPSPKSDTTTSPTSSPGLLLEDGKGIYDSSGMWYPSIVAKVIAEAIGRDQRDGNHNSIFPCVDVVETGQIRILQKPRNHGGSITTPPQVLSPPTIADNENPIPNGQDQDSSMVPRFMENKEGTIICDNNKGGPQQMSVNHDLLTLVSSTSQFCKEDDGWEPNERFERNCQVFDVPSEEFDE